MESVKIGLTARSFELGVGTKQHLVQLPVQFRRTSRYEVDNIVRSIIMEHVMVNNSPRIRSSFPTVIACVMILWGMQQHVSAQQIDSLVHLADSTLQQRRYPESLKLYERVIAAGSDNPIVWYNAACAGVLARMPEKTWTYLEEAVAHGFDLADHMEQDSDLVSLHSDERWNEIMKRVRHKNELQIHCNSLGSDLLELGALAFHYRHYPSLKNIERGTYRGFQVPRSLREESEGIITVDYAEDDSIHFTIVSKEGHGSISTTVFAQWGKRGGWHRTGDFATLSPHMNNFNRRWHEKTFTRASAVKHSVEPYLDSSGHYPLSTLKEKLPGIIDSLAKYALSSDLYAQETGVGILGKMRPIDDQILGVLREMKNRENSNVRHAAIDALLSIGPTNSGVFSALGEFAELPGNYAAREALAKFCLATKDSVPLLLMALKYSRYDRPLAILRLDSMSHSDPRIVQGFIGALHDEEEYVRMTAAEALAHCQIMLDEIIPALIEELADSALIGRTAAGESLTKFGQKAVPALVRSLKSENIYTRTSAIEALGRILPVTGEMEDAFIRCLEDSNSSVRATASAALARLNTPQSRRALDTYRNDEQLRKAQSDREHQSRKSRVFSLKEITSSIPPNSEYGEGLHLTYSVPVMIKNDTLFLLTVHTDRDRPDQLNIWRRTKTGFEYVDAFESEEGEYHGDIEKPVVFHLKGETFVYLQFNAGGNGHYHDDSIFVVTGRQELQWVEFVPAPAGCVNILKDDETIMNGVSNDIADDTLSFSFGIWKKDDAHCCPTGGSVEGTYKLHKRRTYNPITGKEQVSYRIIVGDYQRLPPKKDD